MHLISQPREQKGKKKNKIGSYCRNSERGTLVKNRGEASPSITEPWAEMDSLSIIVLSTLSLKERGFL